MNEAMQPLSTAILNMLELQYEVESKIAKWYAPIDIASTFFSVSLAAECGHSLLSHGEVSNTPGTGCPMARSMALPFIMD